MATRSLDDLKGRLAGKKVLVRVDFNVPLDKATGAITDDRRIRASLPTIAFLRDEGGIPVLMSHLGRPKGARDPACSLAPAAERLGELLGSSVAFAADCVGPEADSVVDAANEGGVVLLENLRFHTGETANDPDFAAALARHGDVYVNDAFATAHRAHASTAGVVGHFPGAAAAGRLLERELEIIGAAIENPSHPFVAIIGGAKISGKIDVIRNLLPKVDTLLIGGGMACTFFRAMGLEIGTSLLEEDKIDLAGELLAEVKNFPQLKFYLPMDCVAADALSAEAKTAVVPRDKIPAGMKVLDNGPETSTLYAQIVEEAKLVVWNGPMGVFELKPFAAGTDAVAEAMAKATRKGATTIIGGGDSASAIEQAGLAEQVTHVSTGGGASLDLLGGKVLPGVAALENA
jgi:phosphoglycerate kinase